jgi:ABC-2 type transport system permease protein
MNKIWLIVQREYLTRVRKKTFIIATLLFPILYLLLIFGTGYIAEKSKQNLKIAVIDSSGYFNAGMIGRSNLADSSAKLDLVKIDKNELEKSYGNLGYDGYIVIPDSIDWKSGTAKGSLTLNTNKTHGDGTVMLVQAKLNSLWNEIKNDSLGIDSTKKSIIKSSFLGISEKINNKESNSKIAQTIGYVSGFLIYIILLVYGSQVMMGVMEEKTNRIAEVVISSVKPFQLMLGKIIGIGLVALTQFFLWIAFMLVVYNVGKFSSGSSDMMNNMVGGIQDLFTKVNVPLILFCFAFYFLGGFFFYSSLYAAIGSAVNEDMREAQSLSFPVTMLVIFSIAIMTATIQDPNSSIAFWGSMIPFSSPIVMMARIPYGVPDAVPWWQLGLSMLLLIVGFIFTTWFAGKIYRTGILMYGKKPSWKEMIKWVRR